MGGARGVVGEGGIPVLLLNCSPSAPVASPPLPALLEASHAVIPVFRRCSPPQLQVGKATQRPGGPGSPSGTEGLSFGFRVEDEVHSDTEDEQTSRPTGRTILGELTGHT